MSTQKSTANPIAMNLDDYCISELLSYLPYKCKRSLLNTSKMLKNIKENYQYLDLDKKNSLLFLNADFRTSVLSKIKYPIKQLSLNLQNTQELTDVSMLGNVHTLNLAWCNGITDVSMLG